MGGLTFSEVTIKAGTREGESSRGFLCFGLWRSRSLCFCRKEWRTQGRKTRKLITKSRMIWSVPKRKNKIECVKSLKTLEGSIRKWERWDRCALVWTIRYTACIWPEEEPVPWQQMESFNDEQEKLFYSFRMCYASPYFSLNTDCGSSIYTPARWRTRYSSIFAPGGGAGTNLHLLLQANTSNLLTFWS